MNESVVEQAQRNVRYDRPGERRCPARLRGQRCHHEAQAWSYAGLCPLHQRILRGGCRVVLVDGMVLTEMWTAGRPHVRTDALVARSDADALDALTRALER